MSLHVPERAVASIVPHLVREDPSGPIRNVPTLYQLTKLALTDSSGLPEPELPVAWRVSTTIPPVTMHRTSGGLRGIVVQNIRRSVTKSGT